MTTVDSSGYAPEWLRLREPADAAARAGSLAARLPAGTETVIRDLGCGTGSMTRWLAGRLPLPQHWILHDRDPLLLEIAVSNLPARVTAEARTGDLTQLSDFTQTTLVTASALLDLLTAQEVRRLVNACVEAGCPALLTLSVTGDVEITPAEPADGALLEAFNDHQRRESRLGPDAAVFAVREFESRGWTVHTRHSPWRLGSTQDALIRAWYHGFTTAAREQNRRLPVPGERTITAVTVHHLDLLALP
ncbi:hypothetical protein GCM10022222_78990 [Amycolatopsis ultiminotia]|uniref:Methyltransferase domain-containing protein n=1 Tax=Amycolatopsis ultiminotia TaxID=543629 RepID=A0ABP6YHE4_9PSEU